MSTTVGVRYMNEGIKVVCSHVTEEITDVCYDERTIVVLYE